MELLELIEKPNMVVKGTLSILDKHEPIELIYNPKTGEEFLKIVTAYDQAKEALLHEFQKMTLDELLELYRHFSDGWQNIFIHQ